MSLDIWIVCQREPPTPRALIAEVLDPSWVEDGILHGHLGEKWSGVQLHDLLIDQLQPESREERAIQAHYKGQVGALLLLSGRADEWEFDDAISFIEHLLDHTGGVAYDQEGVIYRAGPGRTGPKKRAREELSEPGEQMEDPLVQWARTTSPQGEALARVLAQAVAGDPAGTERLSAWTQRFSWALSDDHKDSRRRLAEGLLEKLTSTPIDVRDVLLKALLELRYTEGLEALQGLFAVAGIPYRLVRYLQQLEELARDSQARTSDNDWSDM